MFVDRHFDIEGKERRAFSMLRECIWVCQVFAVAAAVALVGIALLWLF